MCLAGKNLPPRTRRLMIAGNLCLVAGSMLPMLGKGFISHHANLCDFLRGLFIGLAITFLFWTARVARCRRNLE